MNPSVDVKMSLHKAVMDGMTDVVEAILLRGTDPNQRDEDTGRTVAHCAVQMGNLGILQMLKEYSADMSLFDYRYNTPLCEAVQEGKVQVVEWLLNNIPRKKNLVNDMLLLAAAYGQANVMSTLLIHGANIESKDDLGRNALFHAAVSGQSGAVSFLLKRGANPEVCDDYKKTLLHAAAESGDHNTIELVLKHCLNKKNARDNAGDTPLHCAATTNRKAVALFLDHGAAADLRNDDGYTALDVAIQAEKTEIVDLLQDVIYRFGELIKSMRNL